MNRDQLDLKNQYTIRPDATARPTDSAFINSLLLIVFFAISHLHKKFFKSNLYKKRGRDSPSPGFITVATS